MTTKHRIKGGIKSCLALILFSACGLVFSHPFPEPQLDRVNQLLIQSPNDPELYLLRASVQLRLEHFDDAFADLDRAQAMGLRGVEPLLTRGSAHLQRGEVFSAIFYFSEALVIDPDLPGALGLRAQAYQQNQQPDLALLDWQHLLDISPKPSPSLFMRAAQAADEDSDYSAERLIIDRGLAVWPQDSSLTEADVELLWRQGDVGAAVLRLQTHAASGTARPYYWEVLLADKLILLGRNSEARVALQRAALWLKQKSRLSRGQLELRNDIQQRLLTLDGGDS